MDFHRFKPCYCNTLSDFHFGRVSGCCGSFIQAFFFCACLVSSCQCWLLVWSSALTPGRTSSNWTLNIFVGACVPIKPSMILALAICKYILPLRSRTGLRVFGRKHGGPHVHQPSTKAPPHYKQTCHESLWEISPGAHTSWGAEPSICSNRICRRRHQHGRLSFGPSILGQKRVADK